MPSLYVHPFPSTPHPIEAVFFHFSPPSPPSKFSSRLIHYCITVFPQTVTKRRFPVNGKPPCR